MFFKRVKIRGEELGLYFRDGEFVRLLDRGTHWIFDLWGNVRVERVSQRAPWLMHEKLDVIVKSGALAGRAVVLDLNDRQRGLVWIDGRFSHVLSPGLYAYWTGHRRVETEVIEVDRVRFEHKDLAAILRSELASRVLDVVAIEADHVGVVFCDGRYIETLPSGHYAFWKNLARVKVECVDLRERSLDVAGQEIMTADKVSLRLNAVVAYRVVDARRSLAGSDDTRQTLYREAQLALRELVGTRDLDTFLSEKDAVATEVEKQLRGRAAELGLEVVVVGVRDVILPGEMRDLMNKVTEAKKSAEANLISRREETAAIRSQANTAKLLENNTTLMRIRELEVLEKVATSANLKIVLGEKGLAERVGSLL